MSKSDSYKNIILCEFENKAMGYNALNTLFKTKTTHFIICSTLLYFKKIKVQILKKKKRGVNVVKNMYENIDAYLYTRKRNMIFSLLDDEYTLFIVCIILSTKNYLDTVYTNISWSDISNISLEKLNRAERLVLEAIEYNVFVSKAEMDAVLRSVEMQQNNVVCKNKNEGFKKMMAGIKTFSCLE
ncbi:hypothetical protein SLOPH_1205 [Spraguea lophii 42_110]|uniref:Cyclin N-terminal domain-containing protein n=1 Tax=Spraguea lophii (strain 42_110) TaxID=1358809 RepID=S7W8V6_SPRLO|nr:hypothetical protein SLOPH_1205 [Spraguea lophii 42_110]